MPRNGNVPGREKNSVQPEGLVNRENPGEKILDFVRVAGIILARRQQAAWSTKRAGSLFSFSSLPG